MYCRKTPFNTLLAYKFVHQTITLLSHPMKRKIQRKVPPFIESQKWVTKREMSDKKTNGGGPCGAMLWSYGISFFLCYFLFYIRYALTVTMSGSYTIYKLLATNRDPVSKLGLLNLQVLVQSPPRNGVKTPLHIVVFPVAAYALVLLVVV